MNKPQIIGLGLNGLIGNRITELLENNLDFVSLEQEQGIDVTKPETLMQIKEYYDAEFILHLAAMADVDGCEKQKDLGEESNAWKVNVIGTRNVAEIGKVTGKKVIYFSTDFVFDGEKKLGDSYSELDIPNPINFYAKTKYEGELEVKKSGCEYMILRTAFPYRKSFDKKMDFFRVLKDKLEKGNSIRVVGNQYFCPTFIDDIADVLNKLIELDADGIFHVVGGKPISPYEASLRVADTFDLDKRLITKTTREDFFKGKAQRPFNLNLKNDKISELGVKLRDFDEGLIEVKRQLEPSR